MQKSGKYMNITVIKLMAAIMVIFSHSFPLVEGNQEKEWLFVLTKGQMTFGSFAVCALFMISGYFICGSLSREENGYIFFSRRCLRILPMLWVVVLLSAFVLGPCMTALPLYEYFRSAELYRYLLNGVLILQHELPGVFQTNIYGATVNGALWTLPIEVLCYIASYLMRQLKLMEKKRSIVLLPMIVLGEGLIWFVAETYGISILKAVILPTMLFYIGILYYLWRDEMVYDLRIAVLFMFLLVLSFVFTCSYLGMVLFFPYILMTIGLGRKQLSVKDMMIQWIDLSYPLYLVGYPIQQMYISILGKYMNSYFNFIISVSTAMGVARILEMLDVKIHREINKHRKGRR